MDSGSAHTYTAPGTQTRVPANTSTVVHACTGAHPGTGHCQSLGKLGRTRTDLRALRVSNAVPQRPLVLLSRLATNTSSPAFSLPLSLDFLPLSLGSSLPPPHPAKPKSPTGTYL